MTEVYKHITPEMVNGTIPIKGDMAEGDVSTFLSTLKKIEHPKSDSKPPQTSQNTQTRHVAKIPEPNIAPKSSSSSNPLSTTTMKSSSPAARPSAAAPSVWPNHEAQIKADDRAAAEASRAHSREDAATAEAAGLNPNSANYTFTEITRDSEGNVSSTTVPPTATSVPPLANTPTVAETSTETSTEAPEEVADNVAIPTEVPLITEASADTSDTTEKPLDAPTASTTTDTVSESQHELPLHSEPSSVTVMKETQLGDGYQLLLPVTTILPPAPDLDDDQV